MYKLSDGQMYRNSRESKRDRMRMAKWMMRDCPGRIPPLKKIDINSPFIEDRNDHKMVQVEGCGYYCNSHKLYLDESSIYDAIYVRAYDNGGYLWREWATHGCMPSRNNNTICQRYQQYRQDCFDKYRDKTWSCRQIKYSRSVLKEKKDRFMQNKTYVVQSSASKFFSIMAMAGSK